jgi:hypothetical protein
MRRAREPCLPALRHAVAPASSGAVQQATEVRAVCGGGAALHASACARRRCSRPLRACLWVRGCGGGVVAVPAPTHGLGQPLLVVPHRVESPFGESMCV